MHRIATLPGTKTGDSRRLLRQVRIRAADQRVAVCACKALRPVGMTCVAGWLPNAARNTGSDPGRIEPSKADQTIGANP